MTKQRLQEVSMQHFSKFGYEAASLSRIAAEVGIRKSSIYAHYLNKKDLFTQCLISAKRDESQFLYAALTKAHKLNYLLNILHLYKERIQRYTSTQFLLKSIYFTPPSLHEEVITFSNQWMQEFHGWLTEVFEEYKLTRLTPEQAAHSFLCIFDGLMIEYLYAGLKAFEDRLEAIKILFEHGIC